MHHYHKLAHLAPVKSDTKRYRNALGRNGPTRSRVRRAIRITTPLRHHTEECFPVPTDISRHHFRGLHRLPITACTIYLQILPQLVQTLLTLQLSTLKSAGLFLTSITGIAVFTSLRDG